MKKTICMSLLLIFILSAATSYAEKKKLVAGAGTLPKGSPAVSLDLGIDYPFTIGYSAQFDYGVLDRWQIGIGGNFLGVAGTVFLNNKLNLFRSANDAHHLSLLFNAGYFQFNFWWKLKMIPLEPSLAYEYRFGEERKGGLYVKLGTHHWYTWSHSAEYFWKLIPPNPQKSWQNGFDGTLGFQHMIGETFSISVEGAIITRGFFKYAVPGGKLGLHWAY